MNYEETLQYLYSRLPEYQRIGHAAYKEGLDNSLALDAYFDYPHQKYKTIHIGGTNGKGSTSHLLAAILQQAGYKVGLYTSPHLVDFRERIRVNGEMVDKSYVVDFVEKYREAFEPIHPSFFELTMEMGFLYFAKQKVDVAVIEVGLGGRLDSTNIISPDLSVITNIGIEHTQYLGNTLSKIAGEKAGIIKPYTPVVIGEIENEDVRRVFVEKAAAQHAPIVFAENNNDFHAQKTSSGWIFQCKEYPGLIDELGGFVQEKNAKTVLTAVEELKKMGYGIPKDAVYDGFAHVVELTGLMGRWQRVQDKPKIVCDTAHNAHGIRYIGKQLESEKYDRLHIVFGVVKDKDLQAILPLLPKNAEYYFTKPSVERALDEKILAKEAANHQLWGNTFHNVADAVHAARKKATENDFIFIGGSSFVVADALPLFINPS
ncbi:MAG: bifunctional folylpolyglutamate synthase/dihydrofolate synthase [Bacteroidales bacterium]|jgi:dihydrofolate synthase/folylpolyglutamate synthase|nr:bifunctional folylpolyglutamate synthase/dihydrofolate synthase [Bacteroidales bacterium]